MSRADTVYLPLLRAFPSLRLVSGWDGDSLTVSVPAEQCQAVRLFATGLTDDTVFVQPHELE